MRPPPAPIRLLYAVFFASGAAGLGCQMVWTRQFGTGLGHELPALLAVVAAFFGGMTLGAALLDRPIARAEQPVRWYAGLEILLGLWTLATAWLIPPINSLCLDFIGLDPSPLRQGLVTFALPFFALLPATFAMGATLPAMERVIAPLTRDGRCVGGLYAANTFGALAGVLLGTQVLVPALGFRATLWTFGTVDFLCGALLLAWFESTTAPATASRDRSAAPAQDAPLSRLRLAATLFATGLLGIGYEIIGVRALGQVLENTVFTFAAILSVYLLGTAVGATWFQRRLRNRPAGGLLANLLLATATLAALGMATLPFARSAFDALRAALGESVPASFCTELAIAALVFALPTVGMGAMFSLLAQRARDTALGVGHALAWNTAGAALSGIVFGAGLLPVLGLKGSMAVAALGYLVLLPSITVRRLACAAVPLLLLLLLPRDLGLVSLPAGEVVAEHREGLLASVIVSAQTNGARTLRVDNRFQMGSTAALLPQRRQAHLPLLLHPQPRRALFLGPGTGITLGAALEHPELRVEGVELIPEIVAVMPRFAPENNDASHHPRAHLTVADARRFVRVTPETFDVIVADVFHPARDGAGALYSLEHFQAVRHRLAPGGLFCQWLPLHQLDEPTLRSIVRTFFEVFPDAHACLLQFNVDIPVLGLIGATTPLLVRAGSVEERAASTALRQPLRDAALNDTLKALGTLVAGPESLRSLAANAPLNSDDRPFVTFSAPRAAAGNSPGGGGLLESLLGRGQVDFAKLVPADPASTNLAERARTFAVARDLYLRGLRREAGGELNAAIDLYLESARASLYFTPAYARCLSIVGVMARANPAEARRLWQRLEAAQPAQPLGRQVLEPLLGPLPDARGP